LGFADSAGLSVDVDDSDVDAVSVLESLFEEYEEVEVLDLSA
jgi:hypothetical protein